MSNQNKLYCYEKLPPCEFFENLSKEISSEILSNHDRQYYLIRCSKDEKKNLLLIDKQKQIKNESSSDKKPS